VFQANSDRTIAGPMASHELWQRRGFTFRVTLPNDGPGEIVEKSGRFRGVARM
jgi:hypothetical protein